MDTDVKGVETTVTPLAICDELICLHLVLLAHTHMHSSVVDVQNNTTMNRLH